MGNRQQIPEQHAFDYPQEQSHHRRSAGRTEDTRQTTARQLPSYQERRPVQRLPQRYAPSATHRAGHYAGTHPEDGPYMTGEMDDEGEPDEPYYARSHTSVKRYDLPAPLTQGNERFRYHADQVQTTIPPRRSAAQARLKSQQPTLVTETDNLPAAKARRQRRGMSLHALVYLGVGMIFMLALYVGVQFVGSWWQLHTDDGTYGRPRTYQIDTVVGHNDSPQHPTHFVALNLNAQIVIIELPGGNINAAVIYQGPRLYGSDAALVPITLTFSDVDHNGKLDMLVHFQGSEIVYLNVNGKFVPQR